MQHDTGPVQAENLDAAGRGARSRQAVLATALRKRRLELGLSLQQVAQAAGCARSYLSMLETGARDGEIGTALLGRLEHALALPPGSLVNAAHWTATPASVRRRVRELEESQRAAAAALKSTLGAGSGRLDEAYRSGRLHALVQRLDGRPLDNPGAKSPAARSGDPGAGMGTGRTDLRAMLPVQVPLINSVAAGYPREFTDLSYPARVADEYVRVPDICDPDAFAARVVGDSMTPDYREGDIVVFSPARALRSGMDCFVRLERDAETTFKSVYLEPDPVGTGDGAAMVPEFIRLVALNSAYPPRRLHREEVAGVYAAVSVTRPIG